MLIMKCYGKRFGHLDKCADCPCAEYCRTAADLPVGSLHSLETEPEVADSAPGPDSDGDIEAEETYSRGDMLRLVRRLLTLDDMRIRDLIRRKLENPDVSLAAIARAWGTNKTQVHKDMELAVGIMPELRPIIFNRPMYNRWRTPPENTEFRRVRPIRQRRLTKGPRPWIPDSVPMEQPSLFGDGKEG